MIDTKLLRQKILDLAIRGKLVPQDPTDEPASELLKKIKAEKDALVKAGKIKKDKHESHIFKGDDNRYYETIDSKTSDITDEIPFDLPDSWTWCRFSTATINRDGERIPLSQKTREKLEKKYDYYGASGVIDKVDKYLFNERLLLIGEDGANLITRSKPIAFIANGLYWVNNHAHVLQTPTAVLLDYLCCFINAIPLDKYVTGSAQPKMTQDKMNTILIPLPPLAEQQRIVEQIETLQGYVDIIDADAETLDKSITLAKQKILDLAIRGKLVPQDPADEPASELLKKIKAEKDALVKAGKIKKDKHESFIFKSDDNCYYWHIGDEQRFIDNIPFEIPDNWQWCCLAQVMYPIQTKDKQIKSGQVLKSGKYPVISQGQMDIDGFCNDDDKCIVDLPIILFGDHTRKVKYINKPFVVGADGTKIFKPLCNAQWLFYWSLYSADSIANRGYGRHWQLFNSQIIPLPPLSEQEKIVFSLTQFETILKSIQE